MVDLFSFIRLQEGEAVQRVYRSHVLRLVAPLCGVAIALLLPWFFLFDYRGWQWVLVVLWWMMWLGISWYLFDLWSTSLMVETSHRWIAARRERWGRVRVSEWARDLVAGPVWQPMRCPWFGSWVWTVRSEGVSGEFVTRVNWVWRSSANGFTQERSLAQRRKALLRKIAKVQTVERIEQLERVFDEPVAS